jgi:hypothetical protein
MPRMTRGGKWLVQHCWAPILMTAALAGAADRPFTIGERLYSDDFSHGLGQWVVEAEKPGRIEAHGGILTIDVPAGCTVWFRPELSGPILIEYAARMVREGGANDRVSDLNAFWMATDARLPIDLFATKRSGKFEDYNQLKAYYVGQGGNSNTTTRFRRYIGDPKLRPLLPEHDLRSPDVLLKPNVPTEIRLVALDGRIQYSSGGKLIFDFEDPAPYTRGRFGFRTTWSHLEIRHFRVWHIKARR